MANRIFRVYSVVHCEENNVHGVHCGSVFFSVSRDTRGTPFVALRTATQRHKFNQPYQLGTGSRDKAADADPFLFYVRCVVVEGVMFRFGGLDLIYAINSYLVGNPVK